MSEAPQRDNPLYLTSYMDETGHSEDPRLHFAGMAGFVAPRSIWDGLGEYWNTVLKHFKLEQAFHMKEFAHSQGQFKQWKGDEQKKKNLLNALVSGVVVSKLVPVGAIVSIKDYRTLSERQQKAFKDPYHIAFQRCTRGGSVRGNGHGAGNRGNGVQLQPRVRSG